MSGRHYDEALSLVARALVLQDRINAEDVPDAQEARRHLLDLVTQAMERIRVSGSPDAEDYTAMLSAVAKSVRRDLEGEDGAGRAAGGEG